MTGFEIAFAWALAGLAIGAILATAARIAWPRRVDGDPQAEPHGDVPHWERRP